VVTGRDEEKNDNKYWICALIAARQHPSSSGKSCMFSVKKGAKARLQSSEQLM
jgi:hypothetical protein